MAGAKADKEQLREHFHLVRKRLSIHSGKAFAKRIVNNFPSLTTGKTVALYIPMTGEVDTWPLIQKLNKNGTVLLLPVVTTDNVELAFYRYRLCDDLVKGPKGNKEPKETKHPQQPDIIVVPLVAFDETGVRLGQGAGFYDRTLKTLRKNHNILAIGLAFEAQKHDSLPVEAWDQPLDMVVTENHVYDFRPGKGAR